ncbi:Palmitoyltransferase ZDHHC7 [Trichoplax sp. H2]|nr:Palmitoyltransferase ZDHHC7 [Trichoplax sp. H2]|eukprot:RDD47726.1 Palmitoyltransferase ZDHHC7 [Trichoplax sp. H2]
MDDIHKWRFNSERTGITWLILDLLAWTLSFYTCFHLILLTFYAHRSFVIFGYALVMLLLLLSLIHVSLSDPGCLPPPTTDEIAADPKTLAFDYCQLCKVRKPLRSHHCRACKRCFRKLDHHCKFINNCIGEDNQGFFITFLVYCIVASAISGAICVCRLYYIDPNQCTNCGYMSKNNWIVYLVTALSGAVWLFTSMLLLNQTFNLMLNKTTAERIKARRAGKGGHNNYYSSRRNVAAFNQQYHCSWLDNLSKK